MVTRNVKIKLEGEDGASGVFETATKRIGGYLRSIHAEERKSGENFVVKAFEGAGSASEAAFKLLGIGLQAEIAEKIGDAFKEGTAKLVEMREQLQEGKINAADLANEFLKTVPILGSFVEGFENIRELITGEKEELKQVSEEIEAQNKYFEAQESIAKRIRDAHRESLETIRTINNEAKLSILFGEARSHEQAKQAEESAIEAAKEKFRKAKEAAGEDPKLQSALAANQAERQRLDNKIREEQDKTTYNASSYSSAYGGAFGGETGGPDQKYITEMKNRRQQINDAIKALETKRSGSVVDAENNMNAEIKGAQDRRAAEEQRIDRENDLRRENQTYEHTHRISALHGEANRAQLEAAGKVREAEQAALEEQKQNDLDEAKHRRDQVLNTESSLKDQLAAKSRYFEEVMAIQGKYGAQESALAKKQKNEQIDHENEVNNKLVAGRLEHLQAQAQIGDIVAGKEARRLEVQQKFNEKRQEYNRILRDDRASADEKAQAGKLLAGLGGEEQRSLLTAFAAQAGGGGNPLTEFASAGRTTGLAERYKQDFDPMKPVVEALQKLITVSQSSADALAVIRDKGHPDDTPIFASARRN